MLKKKVACAIAVICVLGTGLGGCRKKQEEPASPTDIATQTDETTTVETVETTAETTAETEIVEETNEKGEKRTVVKTKAANSSGSKGNSSGNSGGGQAAAATTAKPTTKAPAPAPTTTAKPARTWTYQGGLSASVESAINSYRVSNGLAALPVSSSLRSKSKTRAEYNAANKMGGHAGGQMSYNGSAGSAGGIVGAWKASSGHNANMLTPADAYDGIGAAVYKDSWGMYYAVVSYY